MRDLGSEARDGKFKARNRALPLTIEQAIGVVSDIKLGEHRLSCGRRQPRHDGLCPKRIHASAALGPRHPGRRQADAGDAGREPKQECPAAPTLMGASA